MHSLKTKLITTLTILLILLFTGAAFILIREKEQELTQDIFLEARSFAELTAENIIHDYQLYLSQNSFIYFNRSIQDIFQKNVDLAAVRIYRYNGELVYDSLVERNQQYQGSYRPPASGELLKQVQARNPSVSTLDSKKTIYLQKNNDGTYNYVDYNEKPVDPLKKDEKISWLVQPATNDFAVVYYISYKALQDRINQTAFRIILLTLLGVGTSILIAIIYAGGITRPLQKLTEGAGIVATGNFEHRVMVKTKDEVGTLAQTFNKMAADLQVSTKALVYKERVAKELELASDIQKKLLPAQIPTMPSLDISAGLLPAEEIGGDLYDFMQLDKDNLLFYLGDVTGHGVPSGIVVSIANAVIYNQAGKKDLKSILIDANHVLKNKTSSNMFITLVMLHWKELEQKFTYVNAGHEQMIHYHAKDKKVTLLPPGGTALGMLPDVSKILKEGEIMLEKNDALIIYSDGIPESWKDDQEMYGMARFKRAVSEYGELNSAMAIRNALIADVKEFAGGHKQMDDITILVLKKK